MTLPQTETLAEITQPHGWTPDKPDLRDFTLDEPEIRNLLFKSQATERLARILAQITQVLYETRIPLTGRTFVNKPLLDDVQKEVEEIERLNASVNKTLLSLVPATLIPNDPNVSTIATEPEKDGKPASGTRIKIQSGTSPDTQHFYLPILGNPQDWQDKEFAFPRKVVLNDRTRIEDQGNLLSCTAHAAIALMEYFELQRDLNRDKNRNPSPSENSQNRLMTTFSSRFLYKVTRTLYHQRLQKAGQSIQQPDTGASLRDTLKAVSLFGVPPEDFWTWNLDQFDVDPPPLCYAYAKNYQAVKYFRLDRPNLDPTILLAQIKAALVAKFPVIFGFRIFEDNLRQGEIAKTGIIPFPPTGYTDTEVVKDYQGNPSAIGHAVMAIGYDDDQETGNGRKGALYFKNSWGQEWGDKGYGWLPYEYVLKATQQNYLTGDWWTLIDANWAGTEQLVGVGEPTDGQGLVLGDPSIFGKAAGKNP